MKFKKRPKNGGRCLIVMAMLLVLVMAASSVYAGSIPRFSNFQNVKMYVVANTGATRQITAISTSTIIPGTHRILGYEVAPIDTLSKENYVVLGDAATAPAVATTTIFGESEAATGSSLSATFPYPREIASGVVVRQGSRTYVTIYYEDKREI